MASTPATPAAAPPQDFGWALIQLRFGNKVTRSGWGSTGTWIKIQISDAMLTAPFLYMYTSGGTLIPWMPNQLDILALDWILVSP